MATVLFDFFGTLVRYSASRTEQGYQATDRVLREAGCDLDYEDWLRAWVVACEDLDEQADASGVEYSMFDAFEAFAARVGLGAGATIASAFVSQYLHDWNRGVEYLPEVPGLLDRLRASGHQTVLVTNTHDAEMVNHHLRRAGIAPGWAGVITSIELGIRKPRPEIYEAALEAASCVAADAVFVGDTFVPDYVGPTSMGIDAYLIVDPLAPLPDGLPPDKRIAAASDVEGVLILDR